MIACVRLIYLSDHQFIFIGDEAGFMVVVTGASGFVGKRLVELLCERGQSVRAMLHDPAKRSSIPTRAEVVIGDVLDQNSLAKAFEGTEIVYHCAAAVGSHFSKQQIYEVNLTGVRNLLECVKNKKSTRVVLLSSVNVLGTRDLDDATEDTELRYSQDPAADVKIDAERLTLEYHKKYDLDVTIIRPGFIYGPGDRHNLPKLISAIKRGKFRFIGTPNNIIPIVHVDDVIQAMLLAGENRAAKGKIYNITNGSRMMIKEFVTTVSQTICSPVPERVLPYYVPALGCVAFEWLAKLGLRKKPAPIARNSLRFLGTSRSFNLNRARRELGYAPSVQLQDGIVAAVRWCQEHGNGDHSPSARD